MEIDLQRTPRPPFLRMAFLQLFWLLFAYRYSRFIVNLWAYHRLKPIPPVEGLGPADVSVIIPCVGIDHKKLTGTLESVLRNRPQKVILATVEQERQTAETVIRDVCKNIQPLETKLQVTTTPKAGKRRQLIEGIECVSTPITVLVDDDVTWVSPEFLRWILAPFEDQTIGGVGSCQRLQFSVNPNPLQLIWSFLGAIYFERRNFDCAATTYLDGGMPCISGRTAAYRSAILRDSDFLKSFGKETWRGGNLQPDDDNFITRWLDSHDWSMWFQHHPDALVLTALENDWKYLKQCLRWSRSNWRSNLQSLFGERFIWRRHPYSTYAVYLTTLNPPSIIFDSGLLWMCHRATLPDPVLHRRCLQLLLLWMLFTKVAKFSGYFRRNPSHIILIPISILFGYLHGIIKVYAGCTLHVTSWGTRVGADSRNNDVPTQCPRRRGIIDVVLWRKRCRLVWDNAWPTGHWRHQLRLFGVALCFLVERILAVVIPLSVGRILSRLDKPGNLPQEVYSLASLHLLDPGRFIASLRVNLLRPVENHWTRNLKTNAFCRVMSFSGEFHDAWNSTTLSEAVSNVDSFEAVISIALFMVVPVIFDVLLTFASICYQIGARAAAMFTIGVAAYVCLSMKLCSSNWKLFAERRRQEREVCRDLIQNWRTVVGFGRLNHAINQFKSALEACLDVNDNFTHLSTLKGLSETILFALGRTGWIANMSNVADIATMLVFFARIRRPLENLHNIIKAVNVEFAKLDPLIEIHELKVPSRPQPVSDLGSGPYSIKFENVVFSYKPQQNPVLSGVSFDIHPGETVAFVGESGSGKSTILSLLLKRYSPQSGFIYVNGNDLLESEQKVAFVDQEPSFLRLSIRENLKYGDPNASDEWMTKVCRELSIHKRVLNCPEQYSTQYQDNMFSGGEKQRLALARALIPKRLPLRLFDEPTNQQDGETASAILRFVVESANKTTTVIVSHKLRETKDVDRIYVLRKGKIVEQGSHGELLKRKGEYLKQWKKS